MLFLSKIKGYLIAATVVYSLTMTGLYLHSQNRVGELEGDFKLATEALTSCTEGRIKSEKSKQGDDSITLGQQVKLKELEKDRQSLLDKLNNLPKKVPKCKPQGSTVDNTPQEEIEDEIDIDAELPDDLNSVLTESYLQYKGSSSTAP